MKYIIVLLITGCANNPNPKVLWDDVYPVDNNSQYQWGMSEQRVNLYLKHISLQQ